MQKVDIIIPIYNAYEFTEECIKSLLKYTDLENNQLLLINDKSPDERILPMLKKYAEQNPDKNIIVLDNKENLGFVKTVNEGMSYSQNDVLLLNSDTEVTKNWLEKMVACAYQNEYIATVTPLTNNGTIASVPNFGVDNELPSNMSLDEYAEMIERCSLNRFPEITTANGFCMFIKRKAIKEVGLFDDVTFEKGYGEENDFCYRALNRGYIHVLCDNTFVYHKGTQSFKKENLTSDRAVLVEEHMEKLRMKHGVYVDKTDSFIKQNPLREIQENIRLNLELYGKKKILFLVNEWKEDLKMTGGTSLHLKDIIQKMKEKVACFVLVPTTDAPSVFNLYLYTDKTSKCLYSFYIDINLYEQISYHDKDYQILLENLFETFHFDIVHVHHFLRHTFDVISVAKKYQAYSIMSLHDLYMLCPRITMLYNGEYCEQVQTSNCTKCFKTNFQISEDILESWRKQCYKTLCQFDRIIAPSENTKEIFKKVYPDLKIDVIEHGNYSYPVSFKENSKKETFAIAFVGVMEEHKGRDILKQLILENKDDKIEIHLFGKTKDELLKKSTENYKYHGEYERKELPQLLVDYQIDLVCLFPLCPETYSYTLSEAFMAKIPVLAYDFGAIADRIRQNELRLVTSQRSKSQYNLRGN